MTSNDENFLFAQKLSFENSFPHAERPSTKETLKTREELKCRILKGSTIPPDFVDEWMKRGVTWSECGQFGRFSRDFRMTTAMILPLYNSVFLNQILLDGLQTPTLKLNGTESQQGVIWDPKNEMVFDKNVVDWVTRFDQLENVTVRSVPGNHHFFIDNHETTSQLIINFINSYKS